MVNDSSKKNNHPGNEKEILLKNDFPYSDYQKWRDEVEKQLKGNSFDEKMITKTYEEIDLKPIYTKNDIGKLKSPEAFPGFAPYSIWKTHGM